MEHDVAVRIEMHESQAWASCVEATGSVAGNPLGAAVDRSGQVALPVLASVNYGLFNRVIGFGVAQPVDEAEISRVRQWYADLAQTDYVLEVSAVARPYGVGRMLEANGLVASASRQAKVWRTTGEVAVPDGLVVRELTTDDRDAFAAVNVAAWGVPPVMGAWFGATLGATGFRHFGVVDDGVVVSVGAMYVTDDLAWLGFGATLPSHRERGMQAATFARRITVAAEMGCAVVHTETTSSATNPSLRNMLKLGFDHAYDKDFYGPSASEE
jgi:hypothetical protein